MITNRAAPPAVKHERATIAHNLAKLFDGLVGPIWATNGKEEDEEEERKDDDDEEKERKRIRKRRGKRGKRRANNSRMFHCCLMPSLFHLSRLSLPLHSFIHSSIIFFLLLLLLLLLALPAVLHQAKLQAAGPDARDGAAGVLVAQGRRPLVVKRAGQLRQPCHLRKLLVQRLENLIRQHAIFVS